VLHCPCRTYLSILPWSHVLSLKPSPTAGYGPNHRLVLPSTAGRNSPADISGASTRYGGSAAAAARTSGSQPSFLHLGTGRPGSSGGSPDMAEYVMQYVVGGEVSCTAPGTA
jgi:hypothetical protein